MACNLALMKTLAIISQKGGAGKTTVAVNLAVAATKGRKQSAIIDLDPQASATSWGDDRDVDLPVVVSAQEARLKHVLAASEEQGIDLAIIDTAPHSERTALAAARAADLVLVICKASIFDLRAIRNSIDLIQIAKKEARILINDVPPRGDITEQAAQAASNYAPVLPERLGHRMAYVHSVTVGQAVLEFEPKGKAAKEIRALYKTVSKLVGL